MYQFYFFDLDGTITDSSLGITNSVRYALAKYGIEEPDRKKLYRFIGPPLTESFREFYGFPEEQCQEDILKYALRRKYINLSLRVLTNWEDIDKI